MCHEIMADLDAFIPCRLDDLDNSVHMYEAKKGAFLFKLPALSSKVAHKNAAFHIPSLDSRSLSLLPQKGALLADHM